MKTPGVICIAARFPYAYGATDAPVYSSLQTNSPDAGNAIDWAALRADFPILDQEVHGRPLVYLDSAASSQKPRAVIHAISRYYEHDHSNVHRGIHELSNRATAAYEGARVRTAEFINARSPDEIVFTRGTTESINLVAAAWGGRHVRAGDKILLTELEHHSNLVPWQMLAQRTGAVLTFLPVQGDNGLLDLTRLDELLTPEVKIFAFTHISNTMGTVNLAAELCARARALGVTTLVDAAQSAGHCPIDVQAMGCDFLVFSGHKILGPTGIGVLYGRAEKFAETPPYQGGGEMIEKVDWQTSTFKSAPHGFEAGTPDVAGAVGLHAAMDYLDAVGRDAIFSHDQALAAYAYTRLSELSGIRLFGPGVDRAGLVSFLLDDVHAHDVVTVADQHGVALRGGHHCNQPLHRKLGIKSTARASFYFYNTREEVDRLVEVVDKIKTFFAR
jgi:cysteine desulfurase/selenocysteine lyase